MITNISLNQSILKKNIIEFVVGKKQMIYISKESYKNMEPKNNTLINKTIFSGFTVY